jgi:hypothetical protein
LSKLAPFKNKGVTVLKILLNFIDRSKKARKLDIFKQCLEKELINLHFYSESEKRLLKKPVFAMKKKEYLNYQDLMTIVKASAYAEAIDIIKNTGK